MALTLALNSTPGTTFSNSGLTNPLSLTFDGILGGTKVVHLLLSNDTASAVTNASITASTQLSSYSSDITSIKFKSGSGDAYVATLSSLTVPANGSHSFYMEVIVNENRSVMNISDISIEVDY